MRLKKLFIQLILFVITSLILCWLTALAVLKLVPAHELQSYQLNSSWLNRHYGYHSAPTVIAFRAGNTRYSLVRGFLFREQTPVAETRRELVGAVLIGEQELVATETHLWVFSQDGKLLKRMAPFAESELTMTSVGVHYSLPVLQTTDGMWRGEPETWQWTPVELFGVSWSESTFAPRNLEASTFRHITLQQLLSDVLSGRIVQPARL